MANIIFIRESDGWIYINDCKGNHMSYLYYSKKDAVRKFKDKFGYRYAKNTIIIDYTKESCVR